MKDRFKFRIYDKKRDVMLTEDNCYEEDNYEHDEWWGAVTSLTITAISSFLDTWNRDNRFVVMQCTGLKDKLGKLIYEGDILKVKGKQTDEMIGFVEWLNDFGKFALNVDSCCVYIDFDYLPENEREIIGNIYQNTGVIE